MDIIFQLVPGLEKPMRNANELKSSMKEIIGVPATHASATQHCTGEAIYVDDLPSPPGKKLCSQYHILK